MKFVLLSDPHLLIEKPSARKDNAIQACWNKLDWVYRFAADEAARVLIAGDLTDGPRSWQLLPILLEFYEDIDEDLKDASMTAITYVVRGQHDVYMRNRESDPKTLMGALANARYINELSSEPVLFGPWHEKQDTVAVYGISWGEPINIDVDSGAKCNILVIHAPVADQALWEGQNHLDATTFLKEHPEFDLILCGDIHRKFAIKTGQPRRWIVNTGPMIRKEASIYNFEHAPCVFLYDTDDGKLEEIEIPHAPANDVLDRSKIEQQELKVKASLNMDSFVEKVKQARKEGYKSATFEDNLADLILASAPRQSAINLLKEVTKCQFSQLHRRVKPS